MNFFMKQKKIFFRSIHFIYIPHVMSKWTHSSFLLIETTTTTWNCEFNQCSCLPTYTSKKLLLFLLPIIQTIQFCSKRKQIEIVEEEEERGKKVYWMRKSITLISPAIRGHAIQSIVWRAHSFSSELCDLRGVEQNKKKYSEGKKIAQNGMIIEFDNWRENIFLYSADTSFWDAFSVFVGWRSFGSVLTVWCVLYFIFKNDNPIDS